MKIIVVSDTHGNNACLDKLVKMYPNCDLYLHAGDSEAGEWSIYPFNSVLGNCDHYADFPEHMKLPIPKGYLWIQHHPSIDIERLKRNNVRLFLFGHTHKRSYKKVDDIIFVNPGAISFARDDNYYSYAVITIEKDGKIDVVFKTLED